MIDFRIARVIETDPRRQKAIVKYNDTGTLQEADIYIFPPLQYIPKADTQCLVMTHGNFMARIISYLDSPDQLRIASITPGDIILSSASYLQLTEGDRAVLSNEIGSCKLYIDGQKERLDIISTDYRIKSHGGITIETDLLGSTWSLIKHIPTVDTEELTGIKIPLIPISSIKINTLGTIELQHSFGSSISIGATGTVQVKNNLATIEISPLGAVKITGLTIDLGTVTQKLVNETFMSLFNAHTHSGVTTGPGVSGVPVTPMTVANLTLKTKAE